MSKKKTGTLISFLTVLIGALLFYFTDGEISLNDYNKKIGDSVKASEVSSVKGDIEVEFLDVGQADAILIRTDNENMLIDAGNNEDGYKLVNYFKSLGITEFSYVVGTHAHEDHIGGMDNIIDNFQIDNFYMPNAITSTATFEDVLDSLEEKNIEFQTPNIDSTFNVGSSVFTVLHTGEDTSDLNNTSIVLKMNYGVNSFLFMGDATSEVEKEILDKDLKADVLKVGHHGSQYSTSTAFLNKVNPNYAIIQVGKGNTYDHPKDVTLKKLEDKNIKIYRTDEDKTIVATSDGKKIDFTTKTTDTNG